MQKALPIEEATNVEILNQDTGKVSKDTSHQDDLAVLPKHTLFKVLYFILAKCKNYTLFTVYVFSVRYMSAVYRPMSICKKKFFAIARINSTYIFSSHLILNI